MRRLASQDPAHGDRETNLDATPHEPAHRCETPKLRLTRKRRPRAQLRREVEDAAAAADPAAGNELHSTAHLYFYFVLYLYIFISISAPR